MLSSSLASQFKTGEERVAFIFGFVRPFALYIEIPFHGYLRPSFVKFETWNLNTILSSSGLTKQENDINDKKPFRFEARSPRSPNYASRISAKPDIYFKLGESLSAPLVIPAKNTAVMQSRLKQGLGNDSAVIICLLCFRR